MKTTKQATAKKKPLRCLLGVHHYVHTDSRLHPQGDLMYGCDSQYQCVGCGEVKWCWSREWVQLPEIKERNTALAKLNRLSCIIRESFKYRGTDAVTSMMTVLIPSEQVSELKDITTKDFIV